MYIQKVAANGRPHFADFFPETNGFQSRPLSSSYRP
jgi:hypothetical protein